MKMYERIVFYIIVAIGITISGCGKKESGYSDSSGMNWMVMDANENATLVKNSEIYNKPSWFGRLKEVRLRLSDGEYVKAYVAAENLPKNWNDNFSKDK